jgi:hypothetical protein
MHIGASAAGAIPRMRNDGAGTCKKSHADRMQRDDGRKRQHGLAANPHTEIAVFDKAKESIHNHPSMPSMGRAIAPLEASHGRYAHAQPRRAWTRPAMWQPRITHTSHQILASCNNCCTQNFAEQNELDWPLRPLGRPQLPTSRLFPSGRTISHHGGEPLPDQAEVRCPLSGYLHYLPRRLASQPQGTRALAHPLSLPGATRPGASLPTRLPPEDRQTGSARVLHVVSDERALVGLKGRPHLGDDLGKVDVPCRIASLATTGRPINEIGWV